jgi:hypothetical protein
MATFDDAADRCDCMLNREDEVLVINAECEEHGHFLHQEVESDGGEYDVTAAG